MQGIRPVEIIPVPVIGAGDRLILEEHSAVVDARLEAVALGPAAVGSALRVRLVIGGRVVRARALAAGHVALQEETEGRP
jgi:flagella basal body P-ring formation protein FlgA